MDMPPYECDKDETVEDPSRALHSNTLNTLNALNTLTTLNALNTLNALDAHDG